MRRMIMGFAAVALATGLLAEQKTVWSQRDVRDPRRLAADLAANATDIQTRIAVVEASGGTTNDITVRPGKDLRAISDNSATTNTIISDGTVAAATLSGNIAVARITEALKTPGAIGGTTPAAGKFTDLTASGTTTLATSLTGAVQVVAGAISAGTLPVGYGGTGAATLTGIIKGNGTSAITAASAGTDYLAPGSITTNIVLIISNVTNTITVTKGLITGYTVAP